MPTPNDKSANEGQNFETKPIAKAATMTSLSQIEANRRNALKSTGPKRDGK